MVATRSKETSMFLFLVLYMLISTNFLSCSVISRELCKFLNILFIGYFILQLLVDKRRIIKGQMFFKKEVIAFILFPLLSGFSCNILEGQSVFLSIKAALPMLVFVLYFYLHKKQVSEKNAMKAVFFIALAIAVIQLVQQFLPGHAIFGIEGEDEADVAANMEHRMRNGLYRFLMHFNGIFTFPLLYYSWSKIRQKQSVKYSVLFILMLVSAYLTLTRQVMVVVLASLMISIFLLKEKTNKKLTFVLCGAFVLALFNNFDSLFGELINKSVNEVGNENYARYYSMSYFWQESTKNLVAFLFGHGLPSSGTAYDYYIQKLADIQCYASDVGAIGAAFKFGWCYVAVFYLMVLKVWVKYRKIIPSYLTLFLVSTLLFSLFMFLISKNYYVAPFAIMLYVIDLHISKSSLASDINDKNGIL